jgi:anthranilate 1,2-dioxygenase reductase subunit
LDLQPSEQVIIEKIKGKLILPSSIVRPLVFVAGGIGIVPFISMLRNLEHRGDMRAITLLYFNRTQASSPYLEELQRLAVAHSEFHLVLIMTRDASWQGEIARFSEQLLSTLLADIKAYDYYVVGTPTMVEAALDVLRASSVASSQIFDEDFTGYSYRPA